ncbi:uncharacterized protein LOC141657139 [Silene latifolia]|uniref:uncharacterized protein LOC141657139 n=1 Tax=Silene latifolia TaxID=37657 RepID=UPI003D76ECC5
MPSITSLSVLSLLIISIFIINPATAESPIIRLPSDTTNEVCPNDAVGSFNCPVNCFRPDPVCGDDGVTYWCGCADARCAGTRVAKRGYCEVGNGGSGSLSGQAFLLVHIVWLIVLGFSVLCGLL